jgi:1-phosphofructokinase family hexose kinase
VILCVAPNPSIDKLFEVERLEPGGIHRPTAFTQVPGGKGLNVARAAATLGGDVHVVALLGGHAGRWVADELGLPLTAVWTSDETRSCLSVADGNSLTEFYETGPTVTAGEWAEFVRTVAELAPSAEWIAVSGSLPPGASGYGDLVTTPNVAVDSATLGDAQPALLKVNLAEARALLGGASGDAMELAGQLRRRIGGAVVVTAGADGAVAVTPDGEQLRGRLDAVGAYPVGSGDAFLAGLLVALCREEDWVDALRVALGAGAANAELPGPGRLVRDRAEALAERAQVERLRTRRT